MDKPLRHSLWLMPSGRAYRQLKSIISHLSQGYSAPNFDPHVTLIGSLVGPKDEILAETAALAGQIQPLEIELTKVDYLDEYFRCLFIHVKETEPVTEANAKARKIFNRQKDPKYMPHLSLLYGNLPPAIKEKIIAEIGREFNLGFKAESIWIITHNGVVGDWQYVKEFPLA